MTCATADTTTVACLHVVQVLEEGNSVQKADAAQQRQQQAAVHHRRLSRLRPLPFAYYRTLLVTVRRAMRVIHM
jgi:hypothetical protein